MLTVGLNGALFRALVIGFLSLIFARESSADLIKFQGGGFGPGLTGYEEAIFQMALEHTQDRYGKFELESVHLDSNLNRVWRLLNTGEHVNIVLSTGIMPSNGTENVAILELPFLHGALGLRQSLVLDNFKQQFDSISTVEQLRNLKVGQVDIWRDVDVYLNNGLPLIGAPDFAALCRMLERERFDYLPLSILQAQKTYKQEQKTYANFQLSEKVFIYYPLKIWAYYGPENSEKAQRLNTGLKTIFENGRAEKFFDDTWGNDLKRKIPADARLFVMSNPNLTDQENSILTQQFLKKYKLMNRAVFVRQIEG